MVRIKKPAATATPARISAMAVTILAGRMSCRQANRRVDFMEGFGDL